MQHEQHGQRGYLTKRTCREDFCGYSEREMATEIPVLLAHNLNTFMSFGILLKYVCRKLLQSE